MSSQPTQTQTQIPGLTYFPDPIYGQTSRDSSTAESVSSSLMPDSEARRSKDIMNLKALMAKELKGAVFQVDLTTANAVFHADDKTVQNVLDCLRTCHNLTPETLIDGCHSSPIAPRLPRDGFEDELGSYLPLTHLLNKVIDVAMESIPVSYLGGHGLRFHPFGKEVNEKYDFMKGLKPDCIGVFGEQLNQGDVSWENIEISIECKRSVKEMVKQVATYARCSLLNNLRRFFALTMGFDFKSLEVYIFVFHRSGLSASRPLGLKTEEGFNGFVRHIVGILSIQGEALYGLDVTRTDTGEFCIDNRFYQLDRYLYLRGSLRGRGTAVYSLEACANNIPNLQSRPISYSEGVTALPNKVVVKLAYQIKGHSQEGPLFSQNFGQFGIGNILGFYNCSSDEPHGSTSLFSKNALYWDILDNKEQEDHYGPEERGLHCLVLSAEGQSLIDLNDKVNGIPSPADLLETILHAMIGHYTLFSRGILHQDISIGNILRYSQAVQRPALEMFECTKDVNYCRGFLIDGDHAIEWRKISGPHVLSGTLPFMSMRLLSAHKAHARGESRPVIQTAVDDLESFLWILVWVNVHVLKDNTMATENNPRILTLLDMFSGDLTYQLAKGVELHFWEDAVFGGLIREWSNILRKAGTDVDLYAWAAASAQPGREREESYDKLESYSKTVYKAVLESGFRHLERVRRFSTWDEVVSANTEMVY